MKLIYLVLSAALAPCALGAPALGQSTIPVPDVRGDQLLFVYDARTARTPFLLIANPSDEPVTIDLSLYPATLTSRLAATTIELPAAGHVIVDPTSVGGGVAVGNAGVAVVTPVAGTGSRTPVVPPVPLAGSFTLANTSLSSAFGENAFGRLAVNTGGSRAAPGSSVDGSAVRYQRFAPNVLLIPVYFAPASLGPVESDGNRVLLAAFTDRYEDGFALAPATAALEATFFDAAGVRIAERSLSASGVLLSDLQSVAGDALLPGSGKVFFAVDAPGASVFGVFSQSLGTFASGHRMSAADAVPEGTVSGPTGCTQADVTASVAWDAAAFPFVSGVAVRVGYAPALVVLPGSGASDTALARVTNLSGIEDGLLEATDQPRAGSGADDLASIALLSLTQPIAPGPFVRVRFDCVGGSGPPAAGDFTCTIEAATLDGSLVAPATCTLSVTPFS